MLQRSFTSTTLAQDRWTGKMIGTQIQLELTFGAQTSGQAEERRKCLVYKLWLVQIPTLNESDDV